MVAPKAEQPETKVHSGLKNLDIQDKPENGDQDPSDDDDEENAGADGVNEGNSAKVRLKEKHLLTC
jgi:hypothetical protein